MLSFQWPAMAPGSKKKEKGVEDSPVDKLTNDILAEIISRVPYKSTFRCKCVSTRWRDLFSHPDHRKKFPQPLAGFFYEGYNGDRFPKIARYFTNVWKGEPLVDPSLSFLPKYESLQILDGCNGLLLCRCWKLTDPTMDYVVCNPATEKWVVVPATDWSSKVDVARLGFDPAVSSHFHVFEFIDEEVWGIDESELSDFEGRIAAVATYSSKSRVWTHQIQMVETNLFAIPLHSKGVFFNGIMHLAAYDNMVVTFDVEGNLLFIIGTPSSPHYDNGPINDVFVSQGQLWFTNSTDSESDHSDLSVWVLEDYSLGKWTLKHTVSHLQLFGTEYSALDYNVIAFHPELNMIFIVCGDENRLMSYEMDSRKRRILRQLGQDCYLGYPSLEVKTPYIPYVPSFTESSADGP